MAILVEDLACRVEGAAPSELSRVQAVLAEGVISALSSSGDSGVFEAAGGHLVKASQQRRSIAVASSALNTLSKRQLHNLYTRWKQVHSGKLNALFVKLLTTSRCG